MSTHSNRLEFILYFYLLALSTSFAVLAPCFVSSRGTCYALLRVAHTRNHFFLSPVLLLACCNFTNCTFSLLAAAICMILRRQWQIHRTDWAGTLFYWMFLLPSAFAMQGGTKNDTRARGRITHITHSSKSVSACAPDYLRSHFFCFLRMGNYPHTLNTTA